MEDLLIAEFVPVLNERHPGLPPFSGTPVVESEVISDKAFDIVDVKGTSGSIKRLLSEGNASYYNGDNTVTYSLNFISFEAFLNQFGDWSKDDGRCDYLVYDCGESKQYFILHELSYGHISNKRSKARNQLFQTLNLLSKTDHLWNQIQRFSCRICILSCKDATVASPLQMADGFMQIYAKLPDPIPMPAKQITRLNFEAVETCDIKL